MRRVGQTRRRDRNEGEIVRALEDLGYEVTRISGKGAPDILARKGTRLYAFEIKSSIGTRTEAQAVTQWPVIRNVQQALEAVGVKP